MADGRCLSDLSDDLLRHILFFAPDKEGASTAVLSRRWRWLWRTSGALFLDIRSFNDPYRDGILRGAEKALATAAGQCHIQRLTLFMPREYRARQKLVEAMVSNQATRRVEELKIFAPQFKIRFGSLPCRDLPVRVLRLMGCSAMTAPPPGAAAFPVLVELHLQNCDVLLVDFQKLVNSAPQLSTLHLKSCNLCIKKDYAYAYDDDAYDDDDDDYDGDADDDDDDEQPYTRDDDGNLFGWLHVPAVTDIMVVDCTYGYRGSLELDVPRLQYFTYRGNIRTSSLLSLKTQASSNMIQVDLDFTSNQSYYNDDSTTTSSLFRQFIQNFNTTKLLKIKLDFTKDYFPLEDKASPDKLLDGLSFYLLDQLELDAGYNPEFERQLMVMLQNMLHSCPIVSDLRLKLRKQENDWVYSSIDKEARLHFNMSVNGFRNRRLPIVSLGGEDDDKYYQAFSIVPCFTCDIPFSCLRSHLKVVNLQFFMDDLNCLGVQLAKFFAENAMVLQEIHIDDGCHEMLEHVNPTVRRRVATTDMGSKQLNVKDNL